MNRPRYPSDRKRRSRPERVTVHAKTEVVDRLDAIAKVNGLTRYAVVNAILEAPQRP